MNTTETIKTAKFPKINYIGNKEKLSKWIVQHFPIDKGTVLDIFAGGNSLSFELKKKGFQVISNDILYSSFVIGKSIIENKSTRLDVSRIDEANGYILSKEDREGFEWLEGKLFYPDEVDELAKLVKYSNSLKGYEKYLFQALIRRGIIRKLPYSRMNVPWNNIVKLRDEEYSYSKYGRKRAYHNETITSHMKSNLAEYNDAVFDNGKDNEACQKDAIDILNQIDFVDAIYLDPPYPNTMNKYNDFYGSFDKMYSKEKKYTNLTIKASFLEKLEMIVEKAQTKTKYILLSLNSNSRPRIDEISTCFSKYGEIRIKERPHNYQVSGKDNKNKNLELLAILELK